MIQYALLILTIVVALTSATMSWRATGGKLSRWHQLLLALSLAVFIYLYGAWVFLSVYLKYIFALCFIGVSIAAVLKKKSLPAIIHKPGRIVLNLLLTVVFSVLILLYFIGTTGRPYGIAQLQLPFKRGTYFVFQGGKGLPTNIFHYGLRGAVYAVDLVKLNRFGNRADNVFSSRLQDYEIFGDTVYSPCNGRIKHATDTNPDNIPPDRKRGPTNTNHVLIETDSMYVFMAHLSYHKVFVKEGDSVTAGQPVGLAGNSGFSLEPHLHIQVHANTHTGIPWYHEKPLWIEFDGKSYLLFDEIVARP